MFGSSKLNAFYSTQLDVLRPSSTDDKASLLTERNLNNETKIKFGEESGYMMHIPPPPNFLHTIPVEYYYHLIEQRRMSLGWPFLVNENREFNKLIKEH